MGAPLSPIRNDRLKPAACSVARTSRKGKLNSNSGTPRAEIAPGLARIMADIDRDREFCWFARPRRASRHELVGDPADAADDRNKAGRSR
jgi:hypothetical protein